MLTSTLAGLSAGGAYALLGVCVVLTYRLVAIMNFTAAAAGALGAFTMVALHEQGLALLPAVIAGVAMGGVVSTLIGFVMARWFADASPATKAAVTVAMLVGLIAIGLRATGGQHPHAFPDIVPGAAFSLAGVVITTSALVTLLLAVALAATANLFLERTQTGLRLRALSERPMAAELIGIRTRLLAIGVWAATGLITTFALILVAPQRSPDFLSLSLLIVPALAAALIGFFRSFWWTVAGGVALGLLEGVASGLTELDEYRGAVPFIIILGVLLWSQRNVRYDEAR